MADIKIGTIIKNDQTGERLIWNGAEWAQGQIAESPSGQRLINLGDGWIDPASIPEQLSEDGASWANRFAIGAAYDDKTKLARAQDLYGAGNVRRNADGDLLFREGANKPWGYVNPPGADWGDVAGAGREIISTLGGIPGAIGGAIGGPAGVVAGGAATGTASSQIADSWAAQLARNAAIARGDTPSRSQTAAEAAGEAINELAGGLGGGAILGGLARAVPRALHAADADTILAYARQGITPPSLGGIIDSSGLHKTEAALAQALGSSKVMERAREQYGRNAQTVLDNTANRVASGGTVPTTPTELGVALQEGAGNSRTAFSREAAQRYDTFRSYEGAPVGTANYDAAIDDMVKNFSEPNQNRIIDELSKYLGPVGNSGTAPTVADINLTRNTLGNLIKPQSLINNPQLQQGQLRRLYGAISDDRLAGYPTDAIRAQVRETDDWYANNKQLRDRLGKLIGNQDGDPTLVGQALLSPQQFTPQMASDLQMALSPEDFARVRAGIIQQLGTPLASANLGDDIAAFDRVLTRTGRGGGAYQPETKDIIFSNEMNDFRTIYNPVLDTMRQKNTSNTAQTADVLKTISSISNIMKMVPRWVKAKVLTSPSLINVLSGHATPKPINISGPRTQALSGNSLPALIGGVSAGVNAYPTGLLEIVGGM